jgi:hypothetical protein
MVPLRRCAPVLIVAVLGAAAADLRAAGLVVGRWDFEGNLDPTTTGPGALTPGIDPVTYTPVTLGGVTGQAATWPQGTPATGEQFFTAPNPIGGNGGGTFTNQYTIVMDVKLDQPGANGGFTSLAQTSTDPHGSDGDLFVRTDGGMGISGNYTDVTNPLRFTYGPWHRVAWVVDMTTGSGSDATGYRVYVDGALQNIVQSPSGWGVDGRYSLGDVFHVFADEDGETNGGSISTLLLYDGALTPREVAALGGPQAAVPEPSAVALLLGTGAILLRRRRR